MQSFATTTSFSANLALGASREVSFQPLMRKRELNKGMNEKKVGNKKEQRREKKGIMAVVSTQ